MNTGRCGVVLSAAVLVLGTAAGCVGPREAQIYKKRLLDAAAARRRQKETAARLGVPFEKSIDLGGGVKLELVLIPAGEFTMGSPITEKKRRSNEGPQHRVRITKPFYMGKYEVTQEQWQQVMRRSPSHFKGNTKNPVELLSWNDCQSFVKKLNARTNEKGTFALPTEAEWEYACRADTSTPLYFGDDERSLDDYAWYRDHYAWYACARKAVVCTHPVGQKKPNAFGLYDMYGNVLEWCADWYGEGYYKKSPKDDPAGPEYGKFRVLRGGSWYQYPGACRSASRAFYRPMYRDKTYGVRVVLRDLK